MADSGTGSEATDSAGQASAFVDLLFGPPSITTPNGSTWTEPPARRLEARRGVRIPPLCAGLASRIRPPVGGRVRLVVKASGRVDVRGMAATSGDRCADVVLTTVSGSLWYHWLPDDRFPAPVELVQPVRLTAVWR